MVAQQAAIFKLSDNTT